MPGKKLLIRVKKYSDEHDMPPFQIGNSIKVDNVVAGMTELNGRIFNILDVTMYSLEGLFSMPHSVHLPSTLRTFP
jgi:hypothetical protein